MLSSTRQTVESVKMGMVGYELSFLWLSVRLQYLQCVSHGDTAVLHWSTDRMFKIRSVLYFCNLCNCCTFKISYQIVWYRADIQLRLRYIPLQWRHNERDGVSNYQLHDCLHKRLFRRRWKKSSELRVTGLREGNSSVTGEFPAQVTRKMFQFDDVIML